MTLFGNTRLTLVLVSLSAVLASCQNGPSSHDQPYHGKAAPDHPHQHFWKKRHRPGIPPEFRTACDGKNIGDSITITLQNGQQIQGNCELRFKPDFPEQPKGPPPHPPA